MTNFDNNSVCGSQVSNEYDMFPEIDEYMAGSIANQQLINDFSLVLEDDFIHTEKYENQAITEAKETEFYSDVDPKLSYLYKILSRKAQQRPKPGHTTGCDSESYLENYLTDIKLCPDQLRSKEMQFDNVCANISKNMNSFLTETYVKNLLGKFPYNIGKRKRRNTSHLSLPTKRRNFVKAL